MLFSHSVIFMPLPTLESWALESRLKPYVHFIPVHSDLSNLADMLEWAQNHDAACKRIARQSTRFVQHLLPYSQTQPHFSSEEKWIRERVVADFDSLWQGLLSKNDVDLCS